MILNKKDFKNKLIKLPKNLSKRKLKRILKKLERIGYNTTKNFVKCKDIRSNPRYFSSIYDVNSTLYFGHCEAVEYTDYNIEEGVFFKLCEEISIKEFLADPNDRVFIENCVIDYLSDRGVREKNIKFESFSDDNSTFRVFFSVSTKELCRMDILNLEELFKDLKPNNTFLGEYIIKEVKYVWDYSKTEFCVDFEKLKNIKFKERSIPRFCFDPANLNNCIMYFLVDKKERKIKKSIIDITIRTKDKKTLEFKDTKGFEYYLNHGHDCVRVKLKGSVDWYMPWEEIKSLLSEHREE